MDSLFEQFAAITKAHAYDILIDQVKQLKEENRQLRLALKTICSDQSYITGSFETVRKDQIALLLKSLL